MTAESTDGDKRDQVLLDRLDRIEASLDRLLKSERELRAELANAAGALSRIVLQLDEILAASERKRKISSP